MAKTKKSSKGWIITIIVLFCVSVILGALAFLGPSLPFFKTSLTEVKMASAIDDTSKRPKQVSETFDPQAPLIYLTAKINFGKKDTTVRVEWYYKEFKVTESSPIVAKGTVYLAFKFEKTLPKWPLGDYTAKVFLDNTLSDTLYFTVAQ